jgi:multiple sugar transport system substrate-binding protein
MTFLRTLFALLALVCVAGALGPAVHAADKPITTIRHGLWDANQRPLYQLCANAFHEANPDIRIRIQQVGWDDYWPALATGFVSGTAPDVFTNHLTRFSEYVLNGVMADLSPLIARDRIAAGELYERGLLEMWQHEGRQYGLPTDWDTIALAVNLEHLRAAGLTLNDLQNLHWNPQDGGSFGRVLERLTQDENGRRGNEPGFDRKRVRIYGYQNPSNGGMMGQSEWSHYAHSAGWRFQSKPWDGALRYDDPVFIATIDWLASLPVKGVSATSDSIGRLGADALFLGGRVAVIPSGSWMINHYLRHAKVKYAWVPLPVGPSGKRASMLNSLALSVWSGSRQTEAAWRWVRYVGSRECQALLAPQGVVYPAVRGLGQIAADAQRQRGIDAQAFIDAARGLTFQPPLVPHGSEVVDLMSATLERVLAGNARASQALPEAARKVRAITQAP